MDLVVMKINFSLLIYQFFRFLQRILKENSSFFHVPLETIIGLLLDISDLTGSSLILMGNRFSKKYRYSNSNMDYFKTGCISSFSKYIYTRMYIIIDSVNGTLQCKMYRWSFLGRKQHFLTIFKKSIHVWISFGRSKPSNAPPPSAKHFLISLNFFRSFIKIFYEQSWNFFEKKYF